MRLTLHKRKQYWIDLTLLSDNNYGEIKTQNFTKKEKD